MADSEMTPRHENTPVTSVAEIMANDQSLLSDFIAEARDHLHSAETKLLGLEVEPENRDALDTIFRAWHSIKGLAGFLGIREINALAHSMENGMELARKGILVMDAGPVDAFLEANDCLKSLIDEVENVLKGGTYSAPGDFRSIMHKMENGLQGDGHFVAPVQPADKKIGEILVDSGAVSPDDVANALEKQKMGDERKIGEILLGEKEVSARTVGNALAAQVCGRNKGAVEETIRVPVSRIDQLVDTIGEAIIAQSMVNANRTVTSLADQELLVRISHANTIMHQLQQLSMSLRMVSLKPTFQKMARLVRDLSKKCGRDIEFITDGEDTELDKTVVENIGDPLVHMIRNSIDHGVEPPQERIAKGKPEKAIVKLSAFHRAGAIYLEISDDGRGLNRDAILRKAISKGLCREDSVLSDDEIYNFIFLPGFSTAEKVTDISGRGVGMDVVHRNIEQLRGSISIESKPGEGTTFTVKLPLTLVVVDGMVVMSGTERYIIPTLSIVESVKTSTASVETVLGRGHMIRVRGQNIPLVNLDAVFRQSDATVDAGKGIVMVVEDMLGRKAGVQIESIIGQQQVVIKNLGDGMGEVPGIAGGAILNDGTVCLILDAGGIIKLNEERGGIKENVCVSAK